MQHEYVYYFTPLFCHIPSVTACYIQNIVKQYKSWPQFCKHLEHA